jgi:hypothetical protein
MCPLEAQRRKENRPGSRAEFLSKIKLCRFFSAADFHCRPRLNAECENVDWIQLAQDRDRWLASVNTVMNLRVP